MKNLEEYIDVNYIRLQVFSNFLLMNQHNISMIDTNIVIFNNVPKYMYDYLCESEFIAIYQGGNHKFVTQLDGLEDKNLKTQMKWVLIKFDFLTKIEVEEFTLYNKLLQSLSKTHPKFFIK